MARVKPTGGGPGGWSPTHIGVRKLIEQIPNDGCLLVFNADHPNWRVKVSETGVLHCYVMDDKKYARVRDLIITWRE